MIRRRQQISEIAAQIDGLDSEGNINEHARVDFIPNYPKDGRHLQVITSSYRFSHDISITKGEDTFYFGDENEKASKPHLWYVYSDSSSVCGDHIKSFRSPVDAYVHACKLYKKALLRELKSLELLSIL